MIAERLEFWWKLLTVGLVLFGSLLFAFQIDDRLGVLGSMMRYKTGKSRMTEGGRLVLVIALIVILLDEFSVWILPLMSASDMQGDPNIWVPAALATAFSFGVVISPGALSSFAGSEDIFREGTLLFCIALMLIIDWASALRLLTSWPVVLFSILGAAIAVTGYVSPRIGISIAAALSRTAKEKQA